MSTANRLFVCAALTGGACVSDNVANDGDLPGRCETSEDCPAGEVCDDGACMELCISDALCAGELICVQGACIEGVRDTPVISNLDGNGPEICPATPDAFCVASGMVVEGDNLEGAEFRLTSSAGLVLDLPTLVGVTNNRVELSLTGVEAGTYTLTAVNGVGTANQDVELLQGPPGPELTGNEMIDRINNATDIISVQRLPIGTTAGDVAAGAHGHDAAEIGGILTTAQLPVGSDASSVASGEHGHDASDLGGTLTNAQLPIGSDASSVAVGDHGHDASELGGALSIAQLPIGTNAISVAVGDHRHNAAELIGALSVAQLPIGSNASSVARGNHGHGNLLPTSGGNISGSLSVGGTNVCLEDGTDCPAPPTPPLSTYEVWGTTTCGDFDTRLYTGNIGGVIMNGGGAGVMCLSDAAVTPNGWTPSDFSLVWRANANAAGTFPGQYANGANNFVCAVCQGATYTHWGENTCASGFTPVYTGYVAVYGNIWGAAGPSPSETICLETSAGAGWTNYDAGRLSRGIGSSGNFRTEYLNADDMRCAVCQ